MRCCPAARRSTDQRGVARPQYLGFDIGAFEVQYPGARFTARSVQPGYGFWLQAQGLPGQAYDLQASTNLANWVSVGTASADGGGFWEWIDRDMRNYERRFYRARDRGIYLPAVSGSVTAPLMSASTYLYQAIQTTDVTNAGTASFWFTNTTAGAYAIQATVNAPGDANNSFFVNIDSLPQAPTMVWDILPYTLGFEPRLMSWRGNGDNQTNQFVPKVFNLTAGAHRLIICGREPNTFLRSITVQPYPAVYLSATSGTVTFPFTIADDYIYQAVETTDPSAGGRAAYWFTNNTAGNYIVQATVNAQGDDANSFFVNMDAEPVSPTMIWDIFPYGVGLQQCVVSWRGTGNDTNNQFIPQIFTLSNGPHQLVIRGREANTLLRDLAVLPYP
jgi:hypothetical protein